VVLENLDQLENLIQQFVSHCSQLETLKQQLSIPSDEFLDKLLYYWSLSHGCLEYPFSNSSTIVKRQDSYYFECFNDYYDRKLANILVRN
jgi:hypothetical protein